MSRKPIEEIEVELTPKRSLLKVTAIVCNVKPVRELEADYKKLEQQIESIGDKLLSIQIDIDQEIIDHYHMGGISENGFNDLMQANNHLKELSDNWQMKDVK